MKCLCSESNMLRPHHTGVLHKKSQEGTQTTMEATLATQQTPQQREQVCASAIAA